MISTLEKPASLASLAMYSGPCGKLRFSAAIDGSAIHSCKRLYGLIVQLGNLCEHRLHVGVVGGEQVQRQPGYNGASQLRRE